MRSLREIYKNAENASENMNFFEVLQSVENLNEARAGGDPSFSLIKDGKGHSAKYILLVKDTESTPDTDGEGRVRLQGNGIRASLKAEQYGRNVVIEQRPYLSFLDRDCNPVEKPEILVGGFSDTHCSLELSHEHAGMKALGEFLSQFASDHSGVEGLFEVSERDKKVLFAVKHEL